MKTTGRLATLLIMASLTIAPARLTARPLDPLTDEFAGCAGRLSAQMEHQWLLSDGNADRTAERRSAMVALLDAVMPPGSGRAVLARRIAAKQAQAVLLTRATFGTNPSQAAWAEARAEAEIASCLANLLG